MSTIGRATYRMHPNGRAVMIADPMLLFSDMREYAIDRPSLLQAIANIKAHRADYHTQEAYDYALAIDEGALAYLDAHADAGR